jgi:hypothetical protein
MSAARPLLLAVALAALTPAADAASDLATLLKSAGAPPGLELGGLERGATIAKVIDTPDKSEVFTLSATRVTSSLARARAVLLRDSDAERPAAWILQLRHLAPDPAPPDFEGMTLDAGDLKQLPRCRTGECEVRLPADVIERFQREISWSGKGQAARANELFRQIMLAYAQRYLAQGDAALFEYANNDDPVHIGQSLQLLVRRMGFLVEIAPELGSFLEGVPGLGASSVAQSLYWMREKFWTVNVLSLNHRVLVERQTAGGRMLVAVTKQLYANHYYDSSLRAAVYLETPGHGSYLMLVGRARADIRRSGFTRIERALLRLLVRGRLESELRYFKQELLQP